MNNINRTFIEDPLRILRAIRQSCCFGFIISAKTVKAITETANRLEIISQERITDEFNKILMSANPVLGFSMLKDYGILDVIMPYYKLHDKFSNILDRIDRLHKTEYYTLETVLGLFFSKRLVDTNIKDYILREFKYSNDTIKEVSLYADNACDIEIACVMKFDAKIRELAKLCGDREHFNKLIAVYKSLEFYENKGYFKFLDEVTDIDLMFGYKLPVNGDDIMEILGIKPGKSVKKIIDYLLEEAFENPKITREECVKLIKEYPNKF